MASSSSPTRRPLTITYLDGFNNQYTFTTSSSSTYTLQYEPMPAMRSSSGTSTLHLTEAQSGSLLKWVDALLSTTDEHEKARYKGTSSMQVQYGQEDEDEGDTNVLKPYSSSTRTRIFLKLRSEKRGEFESFVSELKSTE